MSAIEILEAIGASAKLNRTNSEEAAVIRQQAIDALNELEQPAEKKWCILAPAEDEQQDGEEDQPEEEPSKDDQIQH